MSPSKDGEESQPTSSAQVLPEGYSFTTEGMDPRRILRVELELVDFTLNLTRRDGTQSLITDPVCVQSILNQAKEFNKRLVLTSTSEDTTNIGKSTSSRGKNRVDSTSKIEEKGDAVNEEGENNGGGGNDMMLPLHIEIKLDPLNSVNIYRIPA